MTESDVRPGRFHQMNYPLRGTIAIAYGVRPDDVDGPQWLSDETYDINATTSPTADLPQRLLMLRRLLLERFHLLAHVEQRSKTSYVLRVAREDGQLGPGLKPPTPECAARASTGVLGAPVCGVKQAPSGGIRAGGVPLSVLCTMLSAQLGQAVIDQTGLDGRFSIELDYAPESVRPSVSNQTAPSDSPSLFTALQQQLGLKLESTRTLTDFVVVDHVERPTPD
jgi:uncharacterized protein (TIGR03435 family)